MHRRSLISALAAAAVAAVAPTAWAQARPAGYPTKPVTIIVPFTAGQSGDVLARVLGEPLSRLWGQTLVVDNKGGAGGTLGSRAAASATAARAEVRRLRCIDASCGGSYGRSPGMRHGRFVPTADM